MRKSCRRIPFIEKQNRNEDLQEGETMARGKAINGSGNIRQRSDGRWEARYIVGRDAGTGEFIRKSVYGSSAESVSKKLRAATAAIDEGTYIEPSKMELKKWLGIWLNDYCIDVKERTRITYKSAVNTHIVPSIGAVPLDELQSHIVQRFINSLASQTPELSPKTIKNIHGTLHRALEKAVQLRYMRNNPADNCNLPRIEKKEISFIAGQDLARFLEVIRGNRFEGMFIIAVFTGMRQGELLGLCWDAINFKQGTIKVKRQLQLIQGQYKLVTTKSSKPRTITPPEYVMNVLKAQKNRQLEYMLKAGQLWNNPDQFVFTDEIGQHIARNTLYMNYKRLLKQAGLPETLRFHDLRHSYAVFALENGDNIKEVQEALGHYSSAFTLDTYAHVSEEAAKESAARKNAAIQALKP